MKKEGIYLDYAATTPLDPEISAAQAQWEELYWANPSSQHAQGRLARAFITEQRAKLATLLGVEAAGLVFCASATEANNLILRQQAHARRKAGLGNHLITSSGEHPSVLEVMKHLETEGFTVTYLKLNTAGTIELQDLAQALRPETSLVSLLYVNNETGAINPLRDVASLLKDQEIFFHSDLVQAVGKIPLDLADLGLDAFSATAHKCYGPKGSAVYYLKPEQQLGSVLQGGHQEHGQRAGTENISGIAGLVFAFEKAIAKQEAELERFTALANYFTQGLAEAKINFAQNVGSAYYPGIMNLYLPGLEASQRLILFDLAKIAVSAGAACASGSVKASHVLESMFGSGKRASQSIRFSFGPTTSREELKQVISVLEDMNKNAKD